MNSRGEVQRGDTGVQGDFLINDWLVQPKINTIEKRGRKWHLEPKVMQVLVHLALHPNEVLSKERIIETIWRDTFVGEDVLIRCISEIRYVFGDDPRSPFIIQTIPKAGYRLIATVTTEIDTVKELRGVAELAAGSNGNQAHNEKDVELCSNGSTPMAGRIVKPASEANVQVVERDLPLSADLPETTKNGGPTEKTFIVTSLPQTEVGGASITFRRLFLFGLLAAAFITATWAGIWFWDLKHPSPFHAFWAPVLESHDPVLFCVADQNQYSFITLRDAAEPSRQVVLRDNLSVVVIDDLDTIVNVSGAIRAHGKIPVLKGEEVTTLSDLRNGPSIIVGAFDNAWTLRLTQPLRFHFANNAEMTQFKIIDSNDPSRSPWVINRAQQMATNNYKDFAIVARFTDSNTGKPAVIIAGVGRGGTIAAGEFLTDPEDLAQLIRAIKAGGNKKNLEVVLSTQIIDGQPGTPKIEATYFW
jgi:DNA-binding winged helix-turn-helix (wHTH) protein